MKSVMTNRFARVPAAEIPRASFNRSFGHKTTFDGGYLIPVFWDEAYPGDTFKLRMSFFGRLATPIHPIMDNMSVSSYFFSVPLRQLWSNFRKFMGERVNPADSIDYTVPQIDSSAGGHAALSIYDYLGIPPGIANLEHSALPLRAAYHIRDEWFRDQNLQDSFGFDTDDGPDLKTDYSLFKRGKRHDYFTSSLPWPQKGDAVPLPLGTSADIKYGTAFGGTDRAGEHVIYDTDASSKAEWHRSIDNTSDLGSIGVNATGPIYADLSTATAATINAIRQAFQIQRLLERDARGGTRYAELVKSHFGVEFFDVTYRPEYLGGGRSFINISPVAQTSSTDATTPQANLSAFGTIGIDGHGFSKSFNEHCIVMGFICLDADLSYQQGLAREWSRSTRYDYYWPALATIGEQSVLTKEIYAQGTAEDDIVFGYQERYAELRYKPSYITGQFRSSHPTSLDPWILSQEFGSRPVLDDTFISENPPFDRVIATPAEPHMIADMFFNYNCARPMPVFGIPGMIDHF